MRRNVRRTYVASTTRCSSCPPPTSAASMVKGLERPYHPWGLAGSWLADPSSWGLDPAAAPSLDDVLAVRRERLDEVRQTIAALTPAELDRVCVPPATPGHPRQNHTVRECLHVLLDEEWEHNRYAVRDLDVLESRVRDANDDRSLA